MPDNEQQWLDVENGFKNIFPHAIGTIDGKHIVIQRPDNSGSVKTFSVVLLTLVDNNYNFMYVDFDNQAMTGDGDVFANSLLWQKITSETLNLPQPCSLSNTSNVEVPYVFLTDGAFALHKNIMHPYPGTHDIDSPKGTFNSRLSRSRLIVENIFGVPTSRFQIFRKPINLKIDSISIITKSCFLLHNFLRKSENSSQIYMPVSIVDTYDNNGLLLQEGTWRQDVGNNCALRNITSTQNPIESTISAIQFRDIFAEFFLAIA